MIWFVRRVLPLLLVESAAVAISTRELAESVFFNHVLQNAVVHTFSRSPASLADFFFQAFLNTEIVVQLLVAGSLLVGIFLMRDALRTLRTLVSRQRNLSRFSHVI
ncbi:MAG: hypothetical protein G01um101470_260 [Parcubacteria group bacterium Gr01-1014_70]|nr:MAG: hypothetical protein G01um101470_260 [Parcubacteria group bacterium Gr01-1014_70]